MSTWRGKGSVRIAAGRGNGDKSGTARESGQRIEISLPLLGHTGDPVDGWTPGWLYGECVRRITPYSFVVSMDDFMNFDEGFVRYASRVLSDKLQPRPRRRRRLNLGVFKLQKKVSVASQTGGYSYSFSVANGTGNDVPQILLSPVAGSSFALSQQLFNLSSPLQNGQSGTLSVKIGKVKPGSKVCFFVTLMSKKASCCTVKVCPALPTCGDRSCSRSSWIGSSVTCIRDCQTVLLLRFRSRFGERRRSVRLRKVSKRRSLDRFRRAQKAIPWVAAGFLATAIENIPKE